MTAATTGIFQGNTHHASKITKNALEHYLALSRMLTLLPVDVQL